MNLYRCWLQKCALSHDCGIDILPKSMPSFALDVFGTEFVKLKQVAENLRERYVALSYCWGVDAQTVMLTQSNKSELMSGVSLQALDPTIRDSITVARELGFRLLWIDALCIIQDDDESKRTELGNMSKIYTYATVTTMASRANSVKDGFLHDRMATSDRFAHEDGHPKPIFRFRAQAGNKEDCVVLPEKKAHKLESWYERGWTLQEMLFFGRRLQFRPDRTVWLCHGSWPLAEDTDGGIIPPGRHHPNIRDFYFQNILEAVRDLEGLLSDQILEVWYSILRIYSPRKL